VPEDESVSVRSDEESGEGAPGEAVDRDESGGGTVTIRPSDELRGFFEYIGIGDVEIEDARRQGVTPQP
jgi:hypothetical protein